MRSQTFHTASVCCLPAKLLESLELLHLSQRARGLEMGGEEVALSSHFGSISASWGRSHPRMYAAGVHTDEPHASQSRLELALGPTYEGLGLTYG